MSELLNLLIGIFFLAIGLFFLALPFLINILFQKIKNTNIRIDKLSETVNELSHAIARIGKEASQAEVSKEKTKQVEVTPEVASPLVTTMAAPLPSEPETKIETPPTPAVTVVEPSEVPPAKIPPEPLKPVEAEVGLEGSPPFDLGEKVKAWLLGGNTVARVGVVVLFFGVAFFLKYAVDRGWLPIEVRLMTAAAGGMILVILGWRLRAKRQNYALILQGGGIGIVYLTVFAAVSLYELIPATPGLVLMVVLVVLSSALAVLQDARSLAVFAAVGGFLAPVLISRGGSHVTLFSYYAILDAGILAIAWFKAWRELNLVGFLFTFVIGAVWGYQYYQPAYFPSTEPFLILFFVFYVAVPVLFAQRQPPNLKGYIDGSLIFGLPLVAFGLQSTLVRDFEYGLAISALCMGLFYVTLATVLWQRRQEYLRMLTEVFIALAVAFGTVAIPLAVDGRWTGAAWALEGATLVWVGVRQHRWLARVFGVLVQLGAGMAFLTEVMALKADVPILNSFYLSALMVSIAGLFTAFHLYRFGKQREPASQTAIAMLVWGLLWWFGAGGNEIWVHVDHTYHKVASLVFVALSLAVIAYLRRRLAWSDLAQVIPLMLPVMVIIAVFSYADTSVAHPFANWGLPAWLLAFLIQYWLLRKFEPEWQAVLTNYWHLGTFWLLVFIVSWEAVWLVWQAVPEVPTWNYVMWALVPTMVITLLPAIRGKLAWPLQRFETTYLGTGLVPLIGFIALWAVHANFQPGDPAPLSYIPILNPLELTQLFILIVTFSWFQQHYVQIPDQIPWYSSYWYAVAFLVMNGIIARATHFYGDVPFAIEALWNSPRFQTAVSIIWTLAALVIMVSATRLKQRLTWIIGSALLGFVVLKLFMVDLEDIGTIARIVSFVVVGLLMLLIGYLSPLPPRLKEQS